MTLRQMASRAALVAATVVLFWGVAEVATRAVSAAVPLYDLEMWRYARELKVPVGGDGPRFVHRPNRVVTLMGVEVRTNSAGLRDREFAPVPDPGVVRIAALGDSITFGWGVRQEDAYPKRLEALLNERAAHGRRFEVLNFGVGNYDTEDEYRTLATRALRYHPSVVLVGCFVNDAEPWEPVGDPGLRGRSAFLTWVWGRWDRLLRRVGARPDYVAYYRGLFRPEAAGCRGMERALRRVSALCRDEGIGLVVAMLPELHDLRAYPFRDIHARVKGVVTETGAVFVDLLDALEPGDARRYWVAPDDPHPNAKAHERYARLLAQAVDWGGLAGHPAKEDGP